MDAQDLDEDTRLFIEARRRQIETLLDPATTNEYKQQTAAQIAARIERLASGEETLAPLPAATARPKRKRKVRHGNPEKVDVGAAVGARQQAGGDRDLAWSKFIIIQGLRPGCDAKDFFAWYDNV